MYTLYYFFCGCSDQEQRCHNGALSFGKPPQPGECHSPAQQKKHNRMLLIKTGTECPSRCVLFPGASSEGHSPPGTHIILQTCTDLAAPAAFSTGCNLQGYQIVKKVTKRLNLITLNINLLQHFLMKKK